mgnify:CR=1 FL=1
MEPVPTACCGTGFATLKTAEDSEHRMSSESTQHRTDVMLPFVSILDGLLAMTGVRHA